MNNFTPHEQRTLKTQEENKTGEFAKAKLPAEVSPTPVTCSLHFQAKNHLFFKKKLLNILQPAMNVEAILIC